MGRLIRSKFNCIFLKQTYSEAKEGYDRYNTWEKCVNLAKDIAYDTRTLDNILNNQLKQNMTLWRVQEDHFLSSTKV